MNNALRVQMIQDCFNRSGTEIKPIEVKKQKKVNHLPRFMQDWIKENTIKLHLNLD
jgi:hypothetical protein